MIMSQGSADSIANGKFKRNESFENMGNKTEARVLVLYTGGTIGMIRNEKNGEFTKSLIRAFKIICCQHAILMLTSRHTRQSLLIICFYK